MDPQLCCFVMCDNVQPVDGKYSIMGVFYRIHPASFPSSHNFYLIVGWYGESGNHVFEVNLLGPEGEKLQKLPPCNFTLSPSNPYYNAVINLELTLPREGTYRFEVFINNKLCGRFPLHVSSVDSHNIHQ